MTSILNTKNNYIILTNNIIDSSNVGSLLYIKENITDLSGNRTDANWQTILQKSSNNITYKNRIIVSGKIITSSNTSTSCCLITQNNIKNNMKFIFDSSNNKNGKILFVKNLNSTDDSYNYLFNSLSNTFFEKTNYYNINNSLITDTSYTRYIHHLNYYFSNSDMYQININHYLYKYRNYYLESAGNLTPYNYNYSNIRYAITSISNEFFFNNTTIDSSSIINFKSSNFTTLLIDNSSGNAFTSDNSFTILQKNTSYSIFRNILSYNKLTLDYKHVNYYDLSLYDFSLSYTTGVLPVYTSISNNNMNIIKTFLIKTNSFQIIQNIKSNSKIIFGLKNVYLYNVKVLDYSSNLYTKTITFNNQPNKILNLDFSNTMFLGLGDRLTGITQNDIYNHTNFSTNSNNRSIITFQKNINTQKITSNSNYAPLIPNLNKYYLLDICLNYAKNSISHNINNTINYNIILYNNISLQVGKIFDLNLETYFNALTNNYYKNSFNNLAKINNKSDNIYSISSEQVNSAINVEFKNLTADQIDIKINNLLALTGYGNITLIPIDSDTTFYDLRYNYNKTFYIFHNLNIYLLPESINLKRYLDLDLDLDILNFYSQTFANFVITTNASDFTNVDCIYIYHDPINDPDEKFRYPNNNIEIKRDSEIDTLAKAIEQYRGTGARTSRTNAVFIPAQNGSNLSRKMIQGLVGINNIPKLLSIEPYDPNFITGRGFINQYQINDACITSNCDKIAVKQNSIKHESVKNKTLNLSNTLKKQNFANIVKSNRRNKLSLECINNNTTTNNVVTLNTIINDPNCNNTIKYTPFVMFEKGKGKYL